MASVVKWSQRFRATGSAAARPMGGNRPYVLSSERDWLLREACIALQVFAGDEKGREIIATRIVNLARNGLIDPRHYVIAS